MKASLLFVLGLAVATLSIAPASAVQPASGVPTRVATADPPKVGCSGSAWPIYSQTCRNIPNYKTYIECKEDGLRAGYKEPEMAWYCTSLQLR